MSNNIVEPPPIDPHEKRKRIIAELKRDTDKLVNFFSKSLPIAAAVATAFGYLMLLYYTSTYSIPFPYTFLPYLIMFSVVIVLAAAAIAIFTSLPLYWRLFASNEILRVSAECGWRRLARWPQMRQLVNLFAPAIVFEFAIILDIFLQDSTAITPSVAFVLSLITWAWKIFLFRRYIYNVLLPEDNGERRKVLGSIISYSFMVNIYIAFWYVFVIFFIVRIPQVASYESDYVLLVTALILLLPFAVQFILFWMGAIGERLAIIMMVPVIALFFIIISPGIFMRSTLGVHNMGGSVIATLSVKGDACQHLSDLIEEPSGAESEAVCTTKPVAILLDVGGTIYIKEPSSDTPAETDGEQLAGGEKNNQAQNDREAVWSVDRNSVVGTEVQSRGRPKKFLQW